MLCKIVEIKIGGKTRFENLLNTHIISSTILDNTMYFYGNTEINCCCCYISTEFNTELSCITSNLSRTGKIFQCLEVFHSTTVIPNSESSEKTL